MDQAVIYFESESAITKEMIEEEESILTELLSCSITVQEFRQQAINILDRYLGNR